jgi:hypothetical protein
MLIRQMETMLQDVTYLRSDPVRQHHQRVLKRLFQGTERIGEEKENGCFASLSQRRIRSFFENYTWQQEQFETCFGVGGCAECWNPSFSTHRQANSLRRGSFQFRLWLKMLDPYWIKLVNY